MSGLERRPSHQPFSPLFLLLSGLIALQFLVGVVLFYAITPGDYPDLTGIAVCLAAAVEMVLLMGISLVVVLVKRVLAKRTRG